MARSPVDMTGQKYGKLTCIAPGKTSRSGRYWICECECGNRTEVLRGNLRNGFTLSCGCHKRENNRHRDPTWAKHGYASKANRNPTYNSWMAMRMRCNNKNHESWEWYGGKGIKVCERWDSFSNFLEDMGERPDGKTLDRIDPDKDYSKDNCRWATPLEQTLNRAICK